MYKSLHGLAGISTSPFRRPSKTTRSADDDTFCVLSSRIDFTSTPSILAQLFPASVKSRPSIH